MTMQESIIQKKSFDFAVRIVAFCEELHKERQHVIANQLLRSGTSIGANVEEATAAQSRRDFVAKMAIASKEARETRFWLRVLRASKVVEKDFSAEIGHAEELVRILTAIVKTTSRSSPTKN